MNETLDIDEGKSKGQTVTWVIAGVLAASLIALNLWPSSDDSESPAPEAVVTAPPAVATPKVAKTQRKIEWPEFDFELVVQSNPFETRRSLAEKAREFGDDAQAVAELAGETPLQDSDPMRELDAKKYPVHMIFHSPRGRSALVGNQVVEVGDEIDGMRVIDIAQSGVTLKPID